jgi:2-polyprenyl-3-methyl-5-hydroxy-6-metoxy-1,4-benzoquinol methylase
LAALLRDVRTRLQRPGEHRFVTNAYRGLLGRMPDPEGMRLYLGMLQAGRTRSEVLLSIVRSGEYVERTAARTDVRLDVSDEVFLATVYQSVLGRAPDQEGLRHYRRLLQEGTDRGGVVRALLASDEHVNRVTAELYQLPSLRRTWPERYVQARSRAGGSVVAFHAATPAWFDRLETAILSNDYYDKPGIWELGLNRDKRLMAEIVAALEPAWVLEIGCSNGTVLQSLHQHGVEVAGLDISVSAVARADPSIRERIHVGDLLTAELPQTYDVVFGLDVFEHLNPNKLSAYLSRVRALTNPGGFVFTNLPAFGGDPVFGTVFPMDLEEWDRDAAAGRPFSLLPVDEDGYPFHGHLVWADSAWWVRRFEGAGLRREPAVERALHQRYDEYMRQNSPARRSFYVFSRDADADAVAGLAERIRSTDSAILSQEWDRAAAT